MAVPLSNISRAFRLLVFASLGSCGTNIPLAEDGTVADKRSGKSGAITDPTTGDVADEGVKLYGQLCASCHGPLPQTTKINATADAITVATAQVPAMSHLKSMSPEQIKAIAAALFAPVEKPASGGDDGSALYANFCAACHGDLASSTKLDRSSAQIRQAIESIPAMMSLRSLSTSEVAAVASALATKIQTPPPSAIDGNALYKTHCASCHEDIAQSTKKNRSSEQIKAAIATQPRMASILLSSLQIDAIATLLKTQAPADNDPPDEDGTANREIGTTLYEQNCARCHQPVNASTKKGKSAAAIGSAIQTVPEMSGLTNLKAQELAAIADALASTSTQKRARVAHRGLLIQRFDAWMKPSAAPDITAYNAKTKKWLLDRVSAFGMPCSRYESYCPGSTDELQIPNLEALVDPLPSPMRRGYLDGLCKDLVNTNAPVVALLSRASLSFAAAPTSSDAAKIINVLRPGWTPPSDVLLKLDALRIRSNTLNFSIQDQWRFMILPICKSILVEVL